ncbi:MAG: DoxX family protein [Chitinophagaceae bacterium]|nr:DoxX family protein [Chitinophagaceae bacterium]
MKFLTQTNTTLLNIAILLLRGIVGIIFFVAGAGKVFGWFGGFGLKATVEMFKTYNHISAPLTYLSCFTELIGGLLLIIGFLTRPAAFASMINMLVAVLLSGFQKFFMGGAAYPFSLMMSCIAILLAGPMAYSIDALLVKQNQKTNSL